MTVRDRGASERARARALSATASHRSLRKTPLILRSTDAPRAGAQRGLVRRSAEMTGLETPDARRSAPARMLRREAVFRLYSDSTPKAATRYGHAVHRTRLDPVTTRDIPQIEIQRVLEYQCRTFLKIRTDRGDSRRTPGRRRATGPYRGRHTAAGELSARVQRVERAVQDARVQQLFSSKSSTRAAHPLQALPWCHRS